MKKQCITLGLGLLLSGLGLGQTKFLSDTWDQVLQQARTDDKLIFVDLYFEGCMPCALMDKNVFPDSAIATVLNTKFVNFKTDVFKDDIGKKLSMKYAATGFPTYLFLTAEGAVVDIVTGYIGVPRFGALLAEVQGKAAAGTWKAYARELDMAYPGFYRAAYMESKRRVPIDTITAYLAAITDLTDEIPFAIMTALNAGPGYAGFYASHAQELAKRYGRMPVRNRLLSIVGQLAKQLGEQRELSQYEALLAQIRPIFTDEEWPRFSSGFYTAYYQASKDVDWYLGWVMNDAIFQDWQDKSNALAQVIIDAADRSKELEKIAALLKANINASSSREDLYKAALVETYLNDFESAAHYMALTEAKGKNPFSNLKEEDITALKKAIVAENLTGFSAVAAVTSKPFVME